MALELCRECGTEFDTQLDECPECGWETKREDRSFFERLKEYPILITVVMLVALLMLGNILGPVSSNSPSVSRSTNGPSESSTAHGKLETILWTQESLRDFFPKIETQEGVAWITVSDKWYPLACYEKKRIMDTVMEAWRQAKGGDRETGAVVLEDRYGEEVASFDVIGSPSIAGCD